MNYIGLFQPTGFKVAITTTNPVADLCGQRSSRAVAQQEQETVHCHKLRTAQDCRKKGAYSAEYYFKLIFLSYHYSKNNV